MNWNILKDKYSKITIPTRHAEENDIISGEEIRFVKQVGERRWNGFMVTIVDSDSILKEYIISGDELIKALKHHNFAVTKKKRWRHISII